MEMARSWKSNFAAGSLVAVRQLLRVGLVLFLAAGCFAGRARAQEPSKHDQIYVVVHVDSAPPDAATATKMLQQYVADARKEKGAVRIELYVQISRPNHYSLVEVWANQQAYDAHEGSAQTKQFRERIQSLLASPFDERLHSLLE
jgi:quinol monooxygenase YgiN